MSDLHNSIVYCFLSFPRNSSAILQAEPQAEPNRECLPNREISLVFSYWKTNINAFYLPLPCPPCHSCNSCYMLVHLVHIVFP